MEKVGGSANRATLNNVTNYLYLGIISAHSVKETQPESGNGHDHYGEKDCFQGPQDLGNPFHQATNGIISFRLITWQSSALSGCGRKPKPAVSFPDCKLQNFIQWINDISPRFLGSSQIRFFLAVHSKFIITMTAQNEDWLQSTMDSDYKVNFLSGL